MTNRFDRWSHEGAPSAEENARIQRGIAATMREVLRHDLKNPVTGYGSTGKVSVANAPTVVDADAPKGWAKEVPIALPPGQDAIERLVNAALPHGVLPKVGEER